MIMYEGRAEHEQQDDLDQFESDKNKVGVGGCGETPTNYRRRPRL